MAHKIKLQFLFVVIVFFFISCGSNQVHQSERNDSLAQDSVVVSDSLKKQAPEIVKTIDSTEEKNLRMTVELIADSIIQFSYKNTGASAFRLWTETKGYGLTWNAVDIEDMEGKIVSLKFDGGLRERAGIARAVELKPGQLVSFKENLSALIRFRTSEKEIVQLKKQKYLLTAFYNSSWGPLDRVEGVELQSEHWNGVLKVSGLTLIIQ